MSKSEIQKYIHKNQHGQEILIPFLYIDNATGTFYAVKKVNGKKKSRSLDTKDFRQAKIALPNKLKEIQEIKSNLTKDLLIRDFYAKLKEEKIIKEIKSTTIERMDIIWNYSLEPFWGNLTSSDIHPKLINEFMTWHKRKRPGIQFVNVFKYLGNIFNFMVASGELLPSQVPKLELPKTEKRHHETTKGTYVTHEEMLKILENTDKIKNRLIFEMAYNLGMRIGEICGLQLKRINFDKSTIELSAFDTKTGYGRNIPLTKDMIHKIKEQITPNSKYLFPMISDKHRHLATQIVDRAFRNAVRKAQIKRRINFHSLRHTCATNFAKVSVSPAVACTVLGMSLSVYQKNYLKLQSEDLRIAVQAVSLHHRGEK